MAWLQLETVNGQADTAPLEAACTELGAVAISLRDAADSPILEPAPGTTPAWPATILTALFPAELGQADIEAALAPLLPAHELKFMLLADRDWQADWQATLQPRQFGDRLWVVPPALEAPAAAATVVRLQPGLAFGTGEHATTAMCLRWLEAGSLAGRQVLDYGCGTGLLSIAALALGAAEATAVDIDPQALAATRANAENNGCGDKLRVAAAGEVATDARYDVLVANILSGTLIELAPQLAGYLRPGAAVALTGILARQANLVIAAWQRYAELAVHEHVDDWVLLSGYTHQIPDADVY
ncbi:MAG: 50S ribosomal protein L11 methyltransferase [Gammaproteobacteria bacterium]|jgi:ribosomal protein L11 methyltransferase|nr:50S ribosomal protein L11 methyltransferase [Gammaproteobacteria bacterium]